MLTTKDPYTPIRKVQLQSADGTSSNAFSIQTMFENELGEEQWQESGVVRQDYLGIPNIKVQKLSLDVINASDHMWQEEKVFWNGKKFKLFYTADEKFSLDTLQTTSRADDIKLGLMFENSYDGTTALSARLTLTRIICTNGMMSHKYLPGIKILHNLNNSDKYEDELLKIQSLITTGVPSTSLIRKAFSEMSLSYLDADMIGQIRRNHISKLPTNIFGKCLDKFIIDEQKKSHHTVWDFYNAFTGQLWHEENESESSYKWNSYVTDGFINFADKHLITQRS